MQMHWVAHLTWCSSQLQRFANEDRLPQRICPYHVHRVICDSHDDVDCRIVRHMQRRVSRPAVRFVAVDDWRFWL